MPFLFALPMAQESFEWSAARFPDREHRATGGIPGKQKERKIKMASIKIKVEVPQAGAPHTIDKYVLKGGDHPTTIKAELKKNAVIDSVNANVMRYGFSTFECIYDEKKCADKSKLEKELKAAVSKLGYKVA